MNSNFSAIIACLQEIEIAIEELNISEGASEMTELTEVRTEIKKFFSDPSVEDAKDILSFLKELNTSDPQKTVLNQKFDAQITVDGVKTSLSDLISELTEVIEDLS